MNDLLSVFQELPMWPGDLAQSGAVQGLRHQQGNIWDLHAADAGTPSHVHPIYFLSLALKIVKKNIQHTSIVSGERH